MAWSRIKVFTFTVFCVCVCVCIGSGLSGEKSGEGGTSIFEECQETLPGDALSPLLPPPHYLSSLPPSPPPHPHPLSPTPTVQCILFNDMLVFAHGSTKLSKLELQLDLEAVWVEDLQDLDPQTGQSCSTRHDHLHCLFWRALWPVTGREDLLSYGLGNTATLHTSCSSHSLPLPLPLPKTRTHRQ